MQTAVKRRKIEQDPIHRKRTFHCLIRELLRDLALQCRVSGLCIRNEPLQIHTKGFREGFVFAQMRRKERNVRIQRHDNDPTQAIACMGD